MSVSDIFQIGATALSAQKTALAITGENIANASTTGYSKQTVNMEAGSTILDNGIPVGSGVQVQSISQVYNEFLQQQLASANSSYGGYNTQQTQLQSVQQLFGTSSTSGLGADLNSFFNAWQDLANNPTGSAERQAVLTSAQTVVSDFQQLNSGLTQVQSGANQSLPGITSTINSQLQQIASLNARINQLGPAGSQEGAANSLLDSRNQLLQTLSGEVAITSRLNSNGTVTVTLPQGATLVDGNSAATLSLQANPANSGFYDVMLTPPNATAPQDVTSILEGSGGNQGELGATLAVRDTLVEPFLTGLDELASNLATQVNSLQSAGYDLDGNTGTNFFTTPSGSATDTPGYSSQISLNITSGDQIAAAAKNDGTGNNTNALSIADLANASISIGGGTSTLDGFYNSLVAQSGTAVQNAQNGATQSQSSITQLQQMNDSASGVSLDEELTNLTTYQQAYQAAAKLVTVGTEMMQSVLALIS
jgi:flagellar hook-associated protein 1 FlgK